MTDTSKLVEPMTLDEARIGLSFQQKLIAQQAAEIARLREALAEANERAAGLYEEGRRFLREANSVLRSVNHVLTRSVSESNWAGIQKRVREMLDQHHGLRIYEDDALAAKEPTTASSGNEIMDQMRRAVQREPTLQVNECLMLLINGASEIERLEAKVKYLQVVKP